MKVMKTEEKQRDTNVWDVVIHAVNCILNILKVEKILCILFLYLMYRDSVLLNKIDKNVDVTELMIDVDILYSIINNDNLLFMAMLCIIVVLVAVLLMMFFYVVPMHKKEITRLSNIRSELMHDRSLEKLKEHNSSVTA